jgi:(1->4)-alpha-D-glucan 1-alpha-D-glucosylmutase
MLNELQMLATQTSQQRCEGGSVLCDTLEVGRAKLLIIRSALALQEIWPEVFQQGKYL